MTPLSTDRRSSPHGPVHPTPRGRPAPTRALFTTLVLALAIPACAGDTPILPAGKPAPSASTTAPATTTAPPTSTTPPPPPKPTTTTPPNLPPAASAPPFPTPAPPTGDVGIKPYPPSVQGYGACTHPGCSDAARACDDYLRSGCGKVAWPYQGDPPNGLTPNASFATAVSACAGWTVGQLEEWLERPADGSPPKHDGKDDPKSEDAKRRARVKLLTLCTRNASSCGEMGLCFSGRHVLHEPLTTSPPPIPTTPPVVVPPPDPWTLPLTDPGPDPASSATPWGTRPEMMAVDSPSCVACAVDRCPTIAYKCFGAADFPTHCPAGDCCHALRRCVRDCGAYEPGTGTAKFDACVFDCAAGREHAVQELADLQGCGDVACTGCETKDAPALP